MKYTFASGLTLRWLGSYSKVASEYVEDNDLSPVPFTEFRQDATARYLTQELRLEGADEVDDADRQCRHRDV